LLLSAGSLEGEESSSKKRLPFSPNLTAFMVDRLGADTFRR
jgi:hypothetical protein